MSQRSPIKMIRNNSGHCSEVVEFLLFRLLAIVCTDHAASMMKLRKDSLAYYIQIDVAFTLLVTSSA